MRSGDILAIREACFRGDLEALSSGDPAQLKDVRGLLELLSGLTATGPSSNTYRATAEQGASVLERFRQELQILWAFASLDASRLPPLDVGSMLLRLAEIFRSPGALLIEEIPPAGKVIDSTLDGVQKILCLCLCSFAWSSVARADQAVADARMAMRLAREARLPLLEYLSACALARARRISGRAHLAEWILSALQNYAPPAWSPLIQYELNMARGRCPEQSPETRFPSLESEQRTLSHLLKPGEGSASQFLEDWRQGSNAMLPFGLQSFQDPDWSREQGCFGTIALEPNQPARRVFLVPSGSAPEAGLFKRKRRSAGIVSLLAFASGEVSIPLFFQEVYGFAYVPEKHRGVVDTAVRDARRLLKGLPVELTRTDGAIELRVHGCCFVPDLRCKLDIDDRVLKMLAMNKQLSAGELASKLDVPLRSLQRALSEMADSGYCVSTRKGRHRTYRLLDTTFSPPTRFR